MVERLRSGIIGAGFMGGVHARAVRAAGGVLTKVAAGTFEEAAAAAESFFADQAVESTQELIDADDVDIVHICTPNHLHAPLARLVLAAGKHVICEKPLATSVEDARDLVEAAAAAGVVNVVPFVYRFYPTVRETRERVARGDAGDLRILHGSYLQDWLSRAQESNWRVDPKLGGGSRAFGDIGVHWCDVVEFATGHRITGLSAQMIVVPRTGVDPKNATEDGATVIFETDGGARGSVVISQISPGRKNRLWFSIDGEKASYEFNQELPESLWIGGRGGNSIIPRAAEDAIAPARFTAVPVGHPQGYQDCFTAFIADVHAVVNGGTPDGLPTFADGLRAAQLTASVVESARKGGWVEVPG